MNRRLIGSVLLPLALITLLVVSFDIAGAAPSPYQSDVDASGETGALPQPLRIRIEQSVPLTLALETLAVMPEGDVDGATDAASQATTDTLTVTTPLTDVIVPAAIAPVEIVTVNLVLSIDFLVTNTMTSTVPASVTLELADGFTVTLPISLTLQPVTETTVVILPQAVPTATGAVTVTPELTVTPAVTATPAAEEEPLEAQPAITETDALTVTATPTATLEPPPPVTGGDGLTETAPISATANVTANLRAEPTTDAEIVGTAGNGSVLDVAAISNDGQWYLLANGAWIFGTLIDNPPADLPVATPALIEAVQLAAEAEAEEEAVPEPEATPVPEEEPAADEPAADEPAADEPAALESTVNVNANLRGGPGTTFPLVGGTVTGQAVTILGQNSTGEWYLLDNGGWVAAFLVDNPPADIPVVADDATPESLGVDGAPAAGEGSGGGLILVPTPTPGGAVAGDDAVVGQAEAVYLGDVETLLATYEATAQVLDGQIAAAIGNSELFQNGPWIDNTQAAVETLQTAGTQVRNLEPPPIFAGAHIDLRSAAGSFDTAASLAQEAIDDGSATRLQNAASELEFAGTLLQSAREKLSAAAQ